MRLSVGVSEVMEAADGDLADGVAEATCRPLVTCRSRVGVGDSTASRSFVVDDRVGLLGWDGDSVSVRGLTSLSGRVGLGSRVLEDCSRRFFHGVEDRPFERARRESDRGAGVTLADPGKPYGWPGGGYHPWGDG